MLDVNWFSLCLCPLDLTRGNIWQYFAAGRNSCKMLLFPGHSYQCWYEDLKDFLNKPRRIKVNGVHCESTQVSRKFPGRSAAWENARSLATDGKAEQCRLPMFLSGLVKTKHLEELQKQSGRVAQTPKDDFKILFTFRIRDCIRLYLLYLLIAMLLLIWNWVKTSL